MDVFCILLINRLGRRILLSFSMILAGLGLLASVVVNEYAGSNQGNVSMICLVFPLALLWMLCTVNISDMENRKPYTKSQTVAISDQCT